MVKALPSMQKARCMALQIIQMSIVSAPDELRGQIRHLTRMQLIRALAAWRPDLTYYRNVQNAYRIALKSLDRRYPELHDELADLSVMIMAIVDELVPELIKRKAVRYECASRRLITAGNSQRLKAEPGFTALCGLTPVLVSSGKKIATDLIVVMIVLLLVPCILSRSVITDRRENTGICGKTNGDSICQIKKCRSLKMTGILIFVAFYIGSSVHCGTGLRKRCVTTAR